MVCRHALSTVLGARVLAVSDPHGPWGEEWDTPSTGPIFTQPCPSCVRHFIPPWTQHMDFYSPGKPQTLELFWERYSTVTNGEQEMSEQRIFLCSKLLFYLRIKIFFSILLRHLIFDADIFRGTPSILIWQENLTEVFRQDGAKVMVSLVCLLSENETQFDLFSCWKYSLLFGTT